MDEVGVIATPFLPVCIKRRKNTWYTIASGNWSDPNIWMSNTRRRYNYPQNGDDVYIGFGHTVTHVAAVTTLAVNNLVVGGTLNLPTANGILSIAGDIQATGSINLSSSFSLALNGINNFIANFSSTGTSTVNYSRSALTTAADQPIMDLPYMNLFITSGGTKYLTSNLTVAGTTTIQSPNGVFTTLEMGSYSPVFNGAVTNGGIVSKTGGGSILFNGLFTSNSSCGISFSGNPTVEFRGGLSFTAQSLFNSGTGTWAFTASGQTATLNAGTYQFNGNMSVVGTIDLTVAGNGVMSLNQPIDTTIAGRQVINKGTIYFNSTASLPSFTTGTFDRTSFANTVGYTMPASITLPYTAYNSLLISNTGTKTLSGSTTLSGNLTVNNAVGTLGTLECATYDASITGTSTILGSFIKSGTGNLLFTGLITLSSATVFNLSGNPTVELRGGIASFFTPPTFTSGTGQWKFTTNNQSINNGAGFGSASSYTFTCPLLISGAITLTLSGSGGANQTISISQPFNGDNAASTLNNQAALNFTTVGAVSCMTTGVFTYASTTTNSYAGLGYLFNGDYTIPYTSLNGLTIAGTGTKTLSGNTTVSKNLAINAGTFELSSFDLTVSGTTTQNSVGTLFSKNSTGNVVFVGALNILNLNFNGNPSVECRGGIFSWQSPTFNSGTGQWAFSTANQTISNPSNQASSITFSGNVLISGAITLTVAVGGGGTTITFSGTLNGNNAASTFDNRQGVNYQNAQQPMLTGVLQTNLAANTFIYNAAGNQNVTGGTYRTLTLAGSGVKTLQGNVVVATLYTLTPPATLNTNGFTRS